MHLLNSLLTSFVKNGRLRLINADGELSAYGGQGPGPDVTMRLHDKALHTKIAVNPELHAGEAYMDGTLTFENGSTVGDFMSLFAHNRAGLYGHASQQVLKSAWKAAKRWHQANPIGVAAKNAQHHYDVHPDIYRLFLDEGLNYSCAFFMDPETDTLEQAQVTKLQRITDKLLLKPGMTVAEIGCGWGSMAIHIARTTGASVVAVSPAGQQIAVAKQRAEEAGVGHLCDFRQIDYRELDGKFDRVVSVGMMEHVGIGHFEAYFTSIRNLLTDDGYAMVHCIGRMLPPSTTGPFIRKYIFPGAYVPSLSEVFAATERTAMWVADMEVLRLHYHYTLQHWIKRFAANKEAIIALSDERFYRAWEYYLAAVDVGFGNGTNMVFQLLLSAKIDAVPIVRDEFVKRHP
jgi:cyclopropane-fatty-acyl-phospholipid synthase